MRVVLASSVFLLPTFCSNALSARECSDELTIGLVDKCPVIISHRDNGENIIRFDYFRVRNSCDETMRVAIAYLSLAGDWKDGWWTFDPGERGRLSSEGAKIKSYNQYWYYYTECVDGSCYSGDSKHNIQIGDEIVPMKQLRKTTKGDYALKITC